MEIGRAVAGLATVPQVPSRCSAQVTTLAALVPVSSRGAIGPLRTCDTLASRNVIEMLPDRGQDLHTHKLQEKVIHHQKPSDRPPWNLGTPNALRSIVSIWRLSSSIMFPFWAALASSKHLPSAALLSAASHELRLIGITDTVLSI